MRLDIIHGIRRYSCIVEYRNDLAQPRRDFIIECADFCRICGDGHIYFARVWYLKAGDDHPAHCTVCTHVFCDCFLVSDAVL